MNNLTFIDTSYMGIVKNIPLLVHRIHALGNVMAWIWTSDVTAHSYQIIKQRLFFLFVA